jgi:cell shape-determining protein MreC
MENSILITTFIISVFYTGEVLVGNLTFYLLLLGFLIFPLGIFFVTRYFKKIIVLNHDTLSGKINFLEERNRNFLKEQNAHSAELTLLKEKFAEIENKMNQWNTEKADLEKEIKLIKDQLQHSRKNDDIIIEYYMNEKSGD